MTDPAALPGLPEIPTPVTVERLQRLLAADGWSLDADGSQLLRRWPHLQIGLTLRENEGALMLFRARPIGAETPVSQLGAAESFVADWHRDRIWPVVVMTTTESTLMLQTHVGFDVTAGLTSAQLDDLLRVGIGTTHQCFTALAERGLAPRAPSADPEAG